MSTKLGEVVNKYVNESGADQHPDDEIRDERVELLLGQYTGTPPDPRERQSISDKVADEVHHPVPAELEGTERDNVRWDSRIGERHSLLAFREY